MVKHWICFKQLFLFDPTIESMCLFVCSPHLSWWAGCWPVAAHCRSPRSRSSCPGRSPPESRWSERWKLPAPPGAPGLSYRGRQRAQKMGGMGGGRCKWNTSIGGRVWFNSYTFVMASWIILLTPTEVEQFGLKMSLKVDLWSFTCC